MSEDPTNDASSQPEPSMEDILASIRRILAEDGEADQDDEPDDFSEPEPLPQTLPEDLEAAEPEPVVAEVFETEAQEEPAEVPLALPDDDPEPLEDIQEPIEAPMTAPQVEEPVFELTPAMKAAAEHAVISRPAADSSTDVLSQLAKAILTAAICQSVQAKSRLKKWFVKCCGHCLRNGSTAIFLI